MAFIGREPSYGTFEKQLLNTNGSTTNFLLDYLVSSAASMLVVNAGEVLQPEADYDITDGGAEIEFVNPPSGTTFIVFLGKQYLVPTVADQSLDRNAFSQTLQQSVIPLWVPVSASTTIGAGNYYIVNTSSSAVTLTLPANPLFGQTFRVIDGEGSFATNNCILNPNGKKIMGASSNFTISVNRTSIAFVYNNEANGWIAIENHNFVT